MKNRFFKSVVIILFLSLTLSCQKNPDFGNKPSDKIRVNDLNMISYVSQPVCGGELRSPLFAGKNTRVGEVVVTLKGSVLNVQYKADDGWAISATHLSVTSSLKQVPSTRTGNPQTGLFEYSSENKPAVTGYSYDNILVDGSNEIYVLAHAEVSPVLGWKTNLQSFGTSLPETAMMKVDYPTAGSTSYFKTTVTDGGILNGTYNGWCVDVGNVIYDDFQYPVKVTSSYDQDFSSLGLVEKPQNMTMVNWIINQDYPGKTAPDHTLYTYGDVQRAIWELVGDTYSESGLGPWSPERVKSILDAAAISGKSFEPVCGNNIAVILSPVDLTQPFQITISQIVLTEYPSACEPVCGPAETAWAAGYDLGGSSWAKYFTFCVGN